MRSSAQPVRVILPLICLSSMFLIASDGCGPGPGPEPITHVSAYLPSLPGYQSQPIAGSVHDALEALGVNVGFIGSLLIESFEEVAECLAERGILDIQLYVNSSDPIDLGVIGLVNRSRVGGNILPCTFEAILTRGGRSVDPCGSTGSFEAEGDTILYGYTGVTSEFCSAIGAHFDRL